MVSVDRSVTLCDRQSFQMTKVDRFTEYNIVIFFACKSCRDLFDGMVSKQ